MPPGWFCAPAAKRDGVPTGMDYVYLLNGHVQSRKPQWYPNRAEDAKVEGLLPGWSKTPSRSRPGQYVFAHNQVNGLRVGAAPDPGAMATARTTAGGGALAPGWAQMERGDCKGRYYYENAVTFARVNPQRMDLIHRAVGVVNDEVCTPEEHALIEAEREARKRGKKKKPNQVRPKDDGPAVLGNARK